MIEHPSLQDTSAGGQVSSEAAAMTATILGGEIPLDEALSLVALHLLMEPRIDVVAIALTSFAPTDESGWSRLGGRAWVREWSRSTSTCSILPPAGAGAEAALTMPWLSQFAREELVALVDRELLPAEAAQDRSELARLGIHSSVGTSFISGGEMFGSLSVGSPESGPWPSSVIGDMRLLTTAISSWMTLEHSRRALAEAIEAGTEAQLAYQHFFAAAGHELRTPLAAILGYTEVLVDDAAEAPPSPVAAAMLRDGALILRSCEQLVGVVDSLLGAGRTLSGDDHRQEVSVADAVADVLHWHRTPAQAADVELHVDIDPAITVWAHASGVRQVLTNLLGNAIAHHRIEGGSVHLTSERLLGESSRPMVRIIVRDDGPGLRAEQMRHIFEPFVRFADRRTKGSGLGLSISRTIAERDGGAVQGESAPGRGSSFWLELPTSAPAGA